jgi:hypothetical protein
MAYAGRSARASRLGRWGAQEFWGSSSRALAGGIQGSGGAQRECRKASAPMRLKRLILVVSATLVTPPARRAIRSTCGGAAAASRRRRAKRAARIKARREAAGGLSVPGKACQWTGQLEPEPIILCRN